MIKMKIAIVFIICLTASSSLFSQRVDDMLSKEEMNKEFDYLIELVSEVNPHLPIYKQMMNYDVIDEMKKKRKEIKQIKNWAEYYMFLSSVISKIPEAHTRMMIWAIPEHYTKLYPYLVDSTSTLNIDKVDRDFDKFMPDVYGEIQEKKGVYNINLSYIDGKFYNLHGVKNIDNETGDEQYIRSGWELLEINRLPILKFVKCNRFNYSDCNIWDVNNNILYNRHPTLGSNSIYQNIHNGSIACNDLTMTFLNPSGEKVIVKYAYRDTNKQPLHNFYEFAEPEWNWIKNYPERQNKVIYFDSTLYVKMIAMDNLDFFKEELNRYSDVSLKKIVIDVRDNGGGSDDVWSGVLSMIIDTTLCRRGKIAVSDNDIYRKNSRFLSPYIGEFAGDEFPLDSLPIYEDPILKKRYRLLSDGIDCMEIVPDSSSLRYKGQIYLLHNRGSFSSSTAFLTFALGEERVVAVGEHNGCLGGYGVSPFVFQLPYSKLAFVMHSTIHIPDNAKSVEDYFWNKTEVEVTTTPEWEVLMYLDSDFFTPEILKTKDPFFKKVMEL